MIPNPQHPKPHTTPSQGFAVLRYSLVFVLLSIVALAEPALSSNYGQIEKQLLDCRHRVCLRKLIRGQFAIGVQEKHCNSLDDRFSEGFFKENMGMLCRLYVARQKVGQRKEFPCHDDGSSNPDFGIKLSSLPIWLYAQELYNSSIPEKYKTSKGLLGGGGGTGTVYGTYVFQYRSGRVSKRTGVKKTLRFSVFFCQAGDLDGSRYYQPYFYRVEAYTKGPDEDQRKKQYSRYSYVNHTQLNNALVLRQMPRVGYNPEQMQLADINSDGKFDALYIYEPDFGNYKLDACIYRPRSAHCKVVTAKQPVTTDILNEIILSWDDKGGRATVQIKDRSRVNNSVYYRYRLANDILKLDKQWQQ